MVMPLIVINLGGEMLYILNQRLVAQGIAKGKAQRVLTDVIGNLFAPKFISELFRTGGVYTDPQTRKVFHALAHSSIMRLNENSMNKLYDLMSMGFKLQLASCLRPSNLIDVTCNHLQGLKSLVKGHDKTVDLIEEVQSKILSTYGSLTNGAMGRLRRRLMLFYQDWRVKVSNFLRAGTQEADGTVRVSHEGECPGYAVPGIVEYADGSTATLTVANARGVTAKGVCTIRLGRNIWYGDGRKTGNGGSPAKASAKPTKPTPPPKPVAATTPTAATAAPPVSPQQGSPASSPPTSARDEGSGDAPPTFGRMVSSNFRADDERTRVVTSELNTLASLLGSGGSSSGSDSKDNFSLNLFQDSSGSGSTAAAAEPSATVITFKGDKKQQQWSKKLQNALDVQEEEEGEEEDDLLALMDGA